MLAQGTKTMDGTAKIRRVEKKTGVLSELLND
jgi:hypothetical protein